MVPGVPPLKPWLAAAKEAWGVDENDPKVKRIVEILKKKEESDISIAEHKEFLLLNSELIGASESVHGREFIRLANWSPDIRLSIEKRKLPPLITYFEGTGDSVQAAMILSPSCSMPSQVGHES
jgi:hypothetical protein